uniref:Uncharacterized protein n=1 Tax=Anguilla anguilla TaxID=7936 RepID=A0A0E9QT36_ANGAN
MLWYLASKLTVVHYWPAVITAVGLPHF